MRAWAFLCYKYMLKQRLCSLSMNFKVFFSCFYLFGSLYFSTSLLVSFVVIKVVDIFMMHVQLINGYPPKAETLCVKKKNVKMQQWICVGGWRIKPFLTHTGPIGHQGWWAKYSVEHPWICTKARATLVKFGHKKMCHGEKSVVRPSFDQFVWYWLAPVHWLYKGFLVHQSGLIKIKKTRKMMETDL